MPMPPLIRSLPREPIEALYVHVPFCAHKCHYCDFYSITRQTGDRMDRFVDRLLTEAGFWSDTDLRPKTMFIGGGTPTLLPIDAMRRLLDGLRARIDFSALDEFTIEANPATVTAEYCRMLRDTGVDRLSFGGQSFDRRELAVLQRNHDPDDVPRSVEIARAAGFRRLNVDLIYAIPGQTLDSWTQSLSAVLRLELPHLSCYGLTYEPNTAMTVRRRLGQFVPVPDEAELEMFRLARRLTAAAGYDAYEISNFARPGEACRHNLNYWNGGNYAALGPSAAAHVGGWRFRNRPHLGEWESAVDAGESASIDIEQLSAVHRAGECIMLRLRLRAGVDLADIADRLGVETERRFGPSRDRLIGLGLLEIDGGVFRLSERGLAVGDAVAAEFLDESLLHAGAC